MSSDLITKLRACCLAKGANGILGLSRVFRSMDDDDRDRETDDDDSDREMDDDDRDRELDIYGIKDGLQEYGIYSEYILNYDELIALFEELDEDCKGTVNVDELLKAVRPPLSQKRIDIIDKAFLKMDKTGNGSVTLQDLKGLYNGKEHPDVIAGKKSVEEVLLEFLANFETPNNADGKVSKEEFIDYYSGVSAFIDLDEYFVTMMERAWQL